MGLTQGSWQHSLPAGTGAPLLPGAHNHPLMTSAAHGAAPRCSQPKCMNRVDKDTRPNSLPSRVAPCRALPHRPVLKATPSPPTDGKLRVWGSAGHQATKCQGTGSGSFPPKRHPSSLHSAQQDSSAPASISTWQQPVSLPADLTAVLGRPPHCKGDKRGDQERAPSWTIHAGMLVWSPEEPQNIHILIPMNM